MEKWERDYLKDGQVRSRGTCMRLLGTRCPEATALKLFFRSCHGWTVVTNGKKASSFESSKHGLRLTESLPRSYMSKHDQRLLTTITARSNIHKCRCHSPLSNAVHNLSPPHAQLRKQPNSNQFDGRDDEVFIDVHISQQIKQLHLDILPHRFFIRRGEEARADDVGYRFDNGLGTLAFNLDDFVACGRDAARSEDIVGEEGASGGLQDRW